LFVCWTTPARGQERPPVYAEALDWLYVRYGPDRSYPSIGLIERGREYPVLRRNPESSWLEIAYSGFAGGRGWVFRDGVTLRGRLEDVPITAEANAGYPALTATPPAVVTSAPVWTVTPASSLPGVSERLDAMSNTLYQYLLDNRFIPHTQMVGSLFFMDLETGDRYSIHPGVAYSGMSLIKLPILVAVYRKIAIVPSFEQAQTIALMIICSENEAANALLRFLGDGDAYRGAVYVTETMTMLGLRDTFLLAPLDTPFTDFGPEPTVPPLSIPRTTADQTATRPDPFNQTTPDDLGWLLSAMYRCALDGTGALMRAFPDAMSMQKCRAMLAALRANDIPALLRAGVPGGVDVAHKHGWVDEVHGDAGIVFSPGGDYVLVVALRNRTWLNYEDSFPVIAELSRLVYNTLNPADALAETHTEPVPLCDLGTIDPALLADLVTGAFPPIR
ncbi:MAG: serine hydrolase, partial [Anaerolineae bacterium]|nr:serine hydrolase [Anaerolineae bacterium]